MHMRNNDSRQGNGSRLVRAALAVAVALSTAPAAPSAAAPAGAHTARILPRSAPQAPAAVTLAATLRDALLNDANANGKADPGDTLRYTVVVTNSGDTDALGMTFSSTLDVNTDLVAGSVRMSPIALPDGYTALRNTPFAMPGPGVLANDSGLPAPAVVTEIKPTSAGGTVTLTTDGGFTYVPASNYFGADTFTYTAQNVIGSDTATVTLNVQTAPLVVNDAYTATRNTPRTVAAPGVLANDAGNPAPTAVAGTYASANGGSVAMNSDGSFTYTPPASFIGADTFIYTATNALGSVAGTVTMDVQSPPLPVNDHYTTTANTPLIVPAPGALGNDAGNPAPAAVSFTGPTTRGGAITLATDGSFTYIPPLNTVSPPSDTVTYTATNALGSATALITIFINPPGPPTAANDSYTATYQTQRTVAAPGVLTNDTVNLASIAAYQASTSQGGNVTLNADGSFAYQPPAGLLSPPVDTFTYTLQNALGASTATASMTVLPPPPVANNDSYAATGNIRISVGASGVLGNDQVNFATLSGYQATSIHGAQIVLNADGSFTYNPPPGFEGNDTFTYTLSNAGGSSTALVTIAVNDVVWFVDNSLSANGDGRLSAPYNTLAALQGADLDEPGDVIFVYQGSGAYTGGFTLENNQALIGQGVGLAAALSDLGITPAPNSDALPGAASNPLIGNAGGHAIALAQHNTLRGLTAGDTLATSYAITGANFVAVTAANVTVNNSTGGGVSLLNGTASVVLDSLTSIGSSNHGVYLGALSGSFSANGGAISNAGDTDFRVNGGTAAITFNGDISDNTGNTVEITVRAGGTTTFGGAINDSGSGIRLSNNTAGATTFNGAVMLNTGATMAVSLINNTGHTISFNGGLNATTNGATTLNATGGGTLSVTGAGSALTATNAPAVNLSGIAIGAGGVTFRSISADGGANGIVMSSVTGGTFEVTGDGPSDPADATRGRTTARQGGGSIAPGSGGVIQNTTGSAVLLNAANAVTLRNMTLSRVSPADVSGIVVTGGSLTLDNVRITGFGNDGLLANGLTGLNILHTEIENNAKSADSALNDESNIRLVNVAGTATLHSSLITDVQETNVRITGSAASTLVFTVTNATIGGTAQDASGGSGVQASLNGSYDLRLFIDNSALLGNYARGVQYAANGSSRGVARVTNSVFEGSFAGIDIANNAVTGQNVSFDVSDNTLNQTAFGSSHAINIVLGGATVAGATLQGTVSNNTIGNAAVANSGSDQGNGINIDARGLGTLTALVTGNTVRQIRQGYGIQLSAGEGSATLNATLQSNDASVNTGSASALAGLGVIIGALPADANTVCLNAQGNTAFIGHVSYAGVELLTAYGDPLVDLVGYTGANNNISQIATFLNSSASTVTPGALVTLSAGTVRGRSASCPQPAPIASLLSRETLAEQRSASKVLAAPAQPSISAKGNTRAASFAPQAGVVSHTIGVLPAGKAVTLTFDVVIRSPVPAGVVYVENQGALSGDNFTPIVTDDPDTPAPNDPTRTLLNLISDLAIAKFVSPGAGRTGQPLTFTLVYTNLGPEYADSFTITDQLPISLTNPAFSASPPVTPTGTFSYTFVGGPLAAGARGVITITGLVTALIVNERITNTARITATGDITPANNTAILGVNLLADDRCWALRGTTVYSSPTVSAIQDAVDEAAPGEFIRAAGYCFGVSSRAGVTQSLFISKPLTIQGGYTPTNWTASYPVTQPTTIDAQNGGRVVYITDTTGTLSNLVLRNGVAADNGGGIYANASLTLSGVLLFGNEAGGDGGGLYLRHASGGSSRIVNSVFGRNSAMGNGMALYLLSPGGGGGAVEVIHTTIGFPTPGSGTALYAAAGSITVTNSIIASHQTGIAAPSGAVTVDGSLFSGNTSIASGNVTLGGGNWLGNAAFVGPLFDNYRLGPTSAAIDIGLNSGVNVDADNALRPRRQGFDAGAYEALAADDVCFARIQSSNQIFSATTALAIQRAIDTAPAPTDTIQIAGLCSNVNTRGGARQSVYLTRSLTLRGGYTSSNWLVAYPVTQPTTIQAADLGRALYLSGPVTPTVRDLRLTGGNAAGLGGGPAANQDAGGGVYVASASAYLLQNTIAQNSGARGGGVYITGSQALLIGNIITGNIAPGANGDGGGVYLHQSRGTSLSSNTLISNTAGRNGGGAHIDAGEAGLSNNSVTSNTAVVGGGIYLANVTATVSANLIYSNQAVDRGGGIFLDRARAWITNTLIADNALSNLSGEGSGVLLWGSRATMLHITLARNTGGAGQGIAARDDTSQSPAVTSRLEMTNCILVSQTVGAHVTGGSSATLTATLFAGNGTDTSGAVSNALPVYGPPAFADPQNGNYRLTLVSAALDRGVQAGVTTDFEGTARPQGAWPDLGYDEAQFSADLAISKAVAPNVALPGQRVTYTLAFTNTGTGIARNGRITDTLPAQLAGPVTVASSGVVITSVAAPPGTLAWLLDDLWPGAGGFITLSGIIAPQIGQPARITNTAIITADNETNPANNIGAAGVDVILPQVRFSAIAYTVTENVAGGQALITALLSQPSFVAVSVTLQTSDHTASSQTDYTPVSRTLSFAPGVTLVTATIGITDDTTLEGIESLTLTLSNPQSALLGTPSQAELFILDDDVPEMFFSSVAYTVTEGAGPARITVTLSGPYPITVTGRFTASEGTARSPDDFIATAGVFTFTPNVTQTTFSVAIVDDAPDELTETVMLAIGEPVNAVPGTPITTTLFIVDNDPPPSVFFSQAIYIVTESAGSALIEVRLSSPSGLTVTARYSTTDGTARAPADYLTATGALTFTPGEVSRFFSVTIVDDEFKEANETVTLRLLDPVNTTLGSPNPATLRILDDDLYRLFLPIARTPPEPFVRFSAPAYTVTENVAGGIAPITVTLTWGYPLTASVRYTVSNGTATSPADYAAMNGTLIFPPYVTQQVIPVSIVNDTLFESNETVVLRLGGPLVRTTITGTNPVTLTIVNDDPPPVVVFSRAGYTATENAGVAVIQLALNTPSGLTATVRYTTSDGTAVAGVDYIAVNGVATFAPGVTQTTFSVPLIDNTQYNGERTINLRIGPPVGNATLGVAQTAVLTITDNEAAPVLQWSAAAYTFSRSAAVAVLMATLSFPSAVTATVAYATADGSARAGEDYQASSGTLVFPPGTVTRAISVPILSTTAFTRSESFIVTLSTPANATLGAPNPATVMLANAGTAPDLVVQSIQASASGITVVIRNVGTAPVVDEFWVDLYVNPNPPPAGVNQIWSDGRSAQGAVWGVTASAFPALTPGGTLVLRLNGPYYVAAYSNISLPLPVGALLYAQVDSANTLTTYGAVYESHEIIGDPYNNIIGPVIVTGASAEAGEGDEDDGAGQDITEPAWPPQSDPTSDLSPDLPPRP